MQRPPPTSTLFPYTTLFRSRASAIAEDARGNLWIGTAGGGLNLLDRKTGRFHHYRRNDKDPNSLSDDAIYTLHVDRRSEEHTSELQSLAYLVCRLLLEKKKT